MLTRRWGRGGAAGRARTSGGAVVPGSGGVTGVSLFASERAMRAFTLATFAFAFGAGFFDAGLFDAGFFDAAFFGAAFFGAGFFAVAFDFDVDFFDFDFGGGVFFRVATASELATAPWVVARHLA
jgi:hypothetical protein